MPSISTILGWGSSATPRFGAPADLVLVVVGVRADSAVAAAAVAELGIRDAIAVDRQMRTSLPAYGQPGTVSIPITGCWPSRPISRWHHRLSRRWGS